MTYCFPQQGKPFDGYGSVQTYAMGQIRACEQKCFLSCGGNCYARQFNCPECPSGNYKLIKSYPVGTPSCTCRGDRKNQKKLAS